MKAKTVLVVLFALCAAAVAVALPDQPFMRAARADLQTAKNELQKAEADKGGHRVNAINLINNAIAEVNAGMEFDRRHNHASTLSVDALFAGAPDQPHMERARLALESAKNNLEKAEADKGGHRVKALDLVKDAISEVNRGIEAGRN
jgi:hypothetical protein